MNRDTTKPAGDVVIAKIVNVADGGAGMGHGMGVVRLARRQRNF